MKRCYLTGYYYGNGCNFFFFGLFFIREKKLLTSSEDYGKDLTGVQNLRKKHQRLEAELNNHEARIQVGG